MRKVMVVAAAVGLVARLGFAGSATSVSGTITTTDPAGSPVDGDFVVLSGGSGQKYTAVSDATGAWTATGVPNDTYSLVAQAPGQQVGKVSGLVVAASPVTQDVELTASGAKFEALGVFGGQIAAVANDA